uniref:IstB-like ATP-binding protein n=1 Tax=consortium cosmid clone pGZ1 TaxID=397422 RepID=Q0MX83_9BACT|nr:istB-like ATP-binding protein [consortium cosmid clone pGZ1]
MRLVRPTRATTDEVREKRALRLVQCVVQPKVRAFRAMAEIGCCERVPTGARRAARPAVATVAAVCRRLPPLPLGLWLTHLALLVVDEIGYLPVSRRGAVLFFQLMSRRYERASIVLTSSKGFEDWGTVLGDEVMAAALIDRVLHHCQSREHPRQQLPDARAHGASSGRSGCAHITTHSPTRMSLQTHVRERHRQGTRLERRQATSGAARS